ncbi:MAG: poly-gamma-glutamate synthase PgsB [Candidatus Stahlbacteria bacterium]|nr:poly-gamma-glutamate synthase PgsB [Candidatus Stahlbacteria bacterium]
MSLLLILIGILILFGYFEHRFHLRNLNSFQVRIHVNGTRGKSSVTRLIAGALRAGGIKVFAKTTGTKPRMIFEDGSEVPIFRPGKANIIEQRGVLARGVEEQAKALVIECMAVKPEYQRFVEQKMIKSTIGVITNAREDHIEEMGPTIEDIAISLCGTIPKNSILFTAEKRMLPILQEKAMLVGTKVITADESEVTDEMMEGFTYIEHKENVALAIKVAEHLGIKPDVAVKGMWAAEPDPGVLRKYHIKFFNREIEFVNAFAANDPESTLLIWDKMTANLPMEHPALAATEDVRIVILVCRSDRVDRSIQMGELIAKKLTADYYILAGAYTDVVEKEIVGLGLLANKVVNLGEATPDRIFEKVLELIGAKPRFHRDKLQSRYCGTTKKCLVFGIGNIVGYGESIVTYFKNRGEEYRA